MIDDPPRRTCLNCDNRHGCLTPQPDCLELERGPDEMRLSGRQLMARRQLLRRCTECGLFRRCWTTETYRATLRGEAR